METKNLEEPIVASKTFLSNNFCKLYFYNLQSFRGSLFLKLQFKSVLKWSICTM